MVVNSRCPTIPLPKSWHASVKSAVLHVISLAHYAIVYARGWAVDSVNHRVRLKAELDRALQEVALVREQERIKDVRMERIPPHRRPHYPTTERMAILELKAARGWSLKQTAEAFLVTEDTISSWLKRVDEEGPNALVQLRQPVNRFPDFVRYAVQRLKVLCPSMGKVKIAETLCRAGLHLGATTVGRMLKQEHKPASKSNKEKEMESTGRVVFAKYPNHLWHVDLTVVPTGAGLWTVWLPFSFVQRWPFCWWVAVVIDHYTRRVMGVAVFDKEPSSLAVRVFLGRTFHGAKAKPRHLVSDKGPQFWCDEFKAWCKRCDIRPRFGAVGKHGSIAVIERAIRTLKQLLRSLAFVPLRCKTFRRELQAIVVWYNEHRPHGTLGGRTPNEVYFKRPAACHAPHFEPRPNWPRGSPCARPVTLVKGKPGAKVKLDVTHHAGRKHLPIVHLTRAA